MSLGNVTRLEGPHLRECEMPFSERSARSRLQVAFKTARFWFVSKLNGDDDGPGTMRDRVTARAVVVPLETSADVICDSDVMPIWVGLAAQDVDDPLLDPVHAWFRRRQWTNRNSKLFLELPQSARGFRNLNIRVDLQKLR